MPDREKVIKGLEAIVNDDWMWKNAGYCAGICKEAHAMLKEQEPCEDAVSRKDVINVLQSPCDMRYDYIEAITNLSAVAPKAQEPQWTPITLRALTEEEKAENPEWCYIIDSPTPDDGEDILVSDGKNVWADVWGNNGTECYLESDHELEGVAWMKMPTPWRKEANA